jgi:hypothetical protein
MTGEGNAVGDGREEADAMLLDRVAIDSISIRRLECHNPRCLTVGDAGDDQLRRVC